MLDRVVGLIKEQFPSAFIAAKEFRGETTIEVKKEAIAEICTLLRDHPDCGFDHLVDLCGADAYTPENRFEIVYNLWSIEKKTRLRVKTFTGETDLHLPTVTGVWPGANWPERETYDMFGIVFDGHPDLRRMYMPDEFDYYPLRKDYPLMGIPGALQLPRK